MVKLGKPIINVIRGDTRRITATFLQSDGTTPIDLTGGTARLTVQNDDDPADDVSNLLIQKTDTSFSAPTTGVHTFTLTHADTNIAAGNYWYDVQFIDSTGAYLSSYRGKFEVQSDITRA